MIEDRLVISDVIWGKISEHLLGKASDRGVMASDNRLFWRRRFGVIWQFSLVMGTAFSGVFAVGPRPRFLISCLTCSKVKLTSSTC